MTGNEYQHYALRTANAELPGAERLKECALGIVGELGEIVDHVKKVAYHGHAIDDERDGVAEELGDLLWYIADTASVFGLSMNGIMLRNIRKLERRYPDGFQAERSRNREE